MFNNYNLTDEDVIGIINKYENLINKYSRLYPGGCRKAGQKETSGKNSK